MRSKINYSKVRLTRDQDRRYKIKEADVIRIRELRANGETITEIARQFNVSINTIRVYLSEDEHHRCLAYNRNFQMVRPYRSREYYNSYARELRAYKRSLMVALDEKQG